MSRLPVGLAYLRASARTAGRALGRAGFQLLPERPKVYGAVLRLYDAGQIRGRVVDASGRPLAGVHVEAMPEPSVLAGCGEHCVTDADGRFAMTNVPLGDLTVCAFRAGYAFGEENLRLRDQADVELRLAAEPDQVRRRVRVLGAEPTTLAQVRFRLDEPTHRLPELLLAGRPDANGEWSFVQLAGFRYERVRVSSPTSRLEPQVADVPSATGATIDFRVVQAEQSVLHGRLLGPDGAPLAGETIVLRSRDGTRNRGKTGTDGRFEVISSAAPGDPCWLHLSDGRYVANQEANASITQQLWGWHQFAFSPADPVTLRAIPAARIHGRVVDANGPVRGVQVRFCVEDRSDARRVERVWSTTTDLEGHFEWNRIRAADHQLSVEVEGYAVVDADRFTLEAGRDLQIEVRTKPAGTVEGQVVDGDGVGLAGKLVVFPSWDVDAGKPGRAAEFTVLTDRHGRFRHIGVPPGGYRLYIVENGEATLLSEPFAVEPGASIRRELTLR